MVGIFKQNKDKIIKWYTQDNLSGCEIIKRLGTKNKKIYKFLRECGIDVRSRRNARLGMKIPHEVIEKTKKTKISRNSYNPFAHMPRTWRKRNKGKTYEQIHGIKKSEKIKEKISKANKGKKGWKPSSNQRINHSIRMKGKFSGEKNYFWGGGIFKSPYPKEFNGQLKLKIRIRDDFTCQDCDKKEKELGYKLHVHHIDYNKENCSENNLISLCRKCHGKTQFKKKDWIEYYKLKMLEK